MRAVVQRVSKAAVTVNNDIVGQISEGLLVLIGIGQGDESAQADWLANKLVHLRIFEDDHGKMNHSLIDANGQMLIISQFTLLGNCRKGRRPSFAAAAAPETAHRLYRHFIRQVQSYGVHTAQGQFQAHMAVSLINDGPVTLIIDSP